MQYKREKRHPYLLITENTLYKHRVMRGNSATARTPERLPSKVSKERDVVQTELSPPERYRVEDLVLRFQKHVVARNEKLKERLRADVLDPEIVRAGLLGLVDADDETLHALVLKARQRN